MKLPLIIRRVEGHSMWPSLVPDDIVLATPLLRPTTGSIVVAKVEGREVIKRVESLDQDKLVLLGDNYYHSRDSRQFGPISRHQVLGTVLGYPRTFNGTQRAIKA